MAKKKECIPEYRTATKHGIVYYRTRITDADGKRVDLYATTREELYKKEKEARQVVEDLVFRKKNPTVADYCEKWLLMHSAKVSKKTLKGYTREMNRYIVEPLGHMYLSDVTADDIRMALVPVAKKSAGTYGYCSTASPPLTVSPVSHGVTVMPSSSTIKMAPPVPLPLLLPLSSTSGSE